MASEPIAYSSLLQDFIEPMYTENEAEAFFFAKCNVGRSVWNLCIALEFDLPIKLELIRSVEESNAQHPEMIEVVNMLKARKNELFKQYKNFIVKTELKTKADGSNSLYVESIPPDKFKLFLW